jgi:hypothetical protein
MACFAQFNPFASFVCAIEKGKKSPDYYKRIVLGAYLTNDKPDLLQHTKKKNLHEIPHGGGYDGPIVLYITRRSFLDSGVTIKGFCLQSEYIVYCIGAKDFQWVAYDSGFGPLQHVVLFDATNNMKEGEQDLIGVWSYSGSEKVEPGNPLFIMLTDDVLKIPLPIASAASGPYPLA